MGFALPETDCGVGALDPLAIVFVQVDGDAAEGLAPLDHRRVVVRVRDGYRGNSAQGFDKRDGVGIDEADAVPKNVAGGGLDEQRALADGKFGFAADAPDSLPFLKERVAVGLAEGFERDPALA